MSAISVFWFVVFMVAFAAALVVSLRPGGKGE